MIQTGRSFLSSGQTGSDNSENLNESLTAATFLPPSVFQSISIPSESAIGTFFALYESITTGEATDIVGTEILGAAVGPELLMFSELVEPVRILLRKVSDHRDRQVIISVIQLCYCQAGYVIQ